MSKKIIKFLENFENGMLIHKLHKQLIRDAVWSGKIEELFVILEDSVKKGNISKTANGVYKRNKKPKNKVDYSFNYDRDDSEYLREECKNKVLKKTTHVGVISITPNGYAFVSHPVSDIYVHTDKIGASISGDIVEIDVRVGFNGRTSGTVIKVLKNKEDNFVGTVKKINNQYILESQNKGGVGRLCFVKNGEKYINSMVSVKVVKYPKDFRDTVIAEVISCCDSPDKPENAVNAICMEFGISTEFPEAAMHEVEKISSIFSEKDKKNRKDYRHLPFITIDGDDAKDFDDAVYLEKNDEYRYLFIAIADVSHYVEIGTSLDKETQSRCTSVYFPGKCVPMLPEILSNGLCSLVPEEDRLVLVAELKIDEEGKMVKYDFYNGIINSKKRMTYNEVEEIINNKDVSCNINIILSEMNILWQQLNENRKERGALDFNSSETKVYFKENNEIIIKKAKRLSSHKLIEEFMLLANEAAATFALKYGNTLLRTHDAPEETKIDDLVSQVETLGVKIFKKKNSHSVMKSIAEQIIDNKNADILLPMTLKAMKQAKYSIANELEGLLHFSLQTNFYTHFTSPIRRYPDLVTHRIIKSVLLKKEVPHELKELETIVNKCNIKERTAVEAERAMIKRVSVRYIQDKTDIIYESKITGFNKNGIFVELVNPPIEGFVTSEEIKTKFGPYKYDNNNIIVWDGNKETSLPLGTKLFVQMILADELKRKINFKIV